MTSMKSTNKITCCLDITRVIRSGNCVIFQVILNKSTRLRRCGQFGHFLWHFKSFFGPFKEEILNLILEYCLVHFLVQHSILSLKPKTARDPVLTNVWSVARLSRVSHLLLPDSAMEILLTLLRYRYHVQS